MYKHIDDHDGENLLKKKYISFWVFVFDIQNNKNLDEIFVLEKERKIISFHSYVFIYIYLD
jgi:hypothetical protein